jgi:hypothetical protein
MISPFNGERTVRDNPFRIILRDPRSHHLVVNNLASALDAAVGSQEYFCEVTFPRTELAKLNVDENTTVDFEAAVESI